MLDHGSLGVLGLPALADQFYHGFVRQVHLHDRLIRYHVGAADQPLGCADNLADNRGVLERIPRLAIDGRNYEVE